MELLHAKQAQLLSLKKDAEERLAAVEREKESLTTRAQNEEEEEVSVNIEELDIVQQLDEMKERKAQVEKLLFQIQSMKSNHTVTLLFIYLLIDSGGEGDIVPVSVSATDGTSELVGPEDIDNKTK